MKRMPQRTCLGCRKKRNKADLIRIVRTSSGDVCVDPEMKMDGRGAYLCRDEKCLKHALKSKALSRALKAEIPEKVRERLNEEVHHDT